MPVLLLGVLGHQCHIKSIKNLNNKGINDTGINMVIQVHSYQLFDFVQSVHYITPANDEIMRYANKLCTQTGAMVSFKPEDSTTSCLLSLVVVV